MHLPLTIAPGQPCNSSHRCSRNTGTFAMGSNPPFREASFDLETTQIMNQAFEFVCMALNNREDFERLKGKMAVYIIQAVRSE